MELGIRSPEYIESILARVFRGLLDALPSQCLVCHAWPRQSLCKDCVSHFAPPLPRCRTCALLLPPGVRQCGDCISTAPPLDACLAAVSYAYPWSHLIQGYKFHAKPGRAGAFALLLRIKDTPTQSSLKRSERLQALKHAFAVEPLLAPQVRGKRLV